MTTAQLTDLAATAVESARSKLPPPLRMLASRVPVHFEAAPSKDLIEEGFEPDILGLFTGSPHGSELREDQPMPPGIILYVLNLWDFSEGDREVFADEARITYLHELGHYFGWDEDDLAVRGLE